MIRKLIEFALLAAVCGVAAELAARVDDSVRIGVPFAHTPDRTIDLHVYDSAGFHGRPNGRYNQYRLNNYGFRGPDIALQPANGCTRVLVLGASETFGSTESPGHEYPAQLRDSLRSRGCYEVLNAGIPGMSLKSLITFWNAYGKRFSPSVVVVYPSSIFYLGGDTVTWPNPGGPSPTARTSMRPRLLERMRNVIETPDFLQRRKLNKSIDREVQGKPPGWLFETPPADRLQSFVRDLDSLVAVVRSDGAEPVLMTHANRFGTALRPEDDFLMLAWRRFTARATSETMLAFERQAAVATRDLAKERGLKVADVDSALTGRGDQFVDFVHFTDNGAGVVAGVIARALVPVGTAGR